jgi:hypothetical protein
MVVNLMPPVNSQSSNCGSDYLTSTMGLTAGTTAPKDLNLLVSYARFAPDKY